MSMMTAAQAAQQSNRDAIGRYAERRNPDPGNLDLDGPGEVEGELLGILAGNLRHPVSHLRSFRGGDAGELAQVAQILADTDRFDDLPVHIGVVDGRCELSVDCDGGLTLVRRLDSPDGGESGLDAALRYATDADAAMKSIADDVTRLGRQPVFHAPVAAPAASPVVPLAPDGMVTQFDWHGSTFRRLNAADLETDVYWLGFQTARPLSDDEMRHLAGIAGYGWRAEVRGENLGQPHRVDDRTFVVAADSTKSRSDDIGEALDRFADALNTMVREGSPVRRTDRAGAGTAGTRALEGMGDLRFAVFAA